MEIHGEIKDRKMKISNTSKTVALILGIAFSIFAINFAVLAFVGPPGDPTYCPSGHVGCDIPLHEGVGGQIKDGPLGIEGVLRAYSNIIVDGKVGIGTDNPSSALHVKGDIQDLFGPFDTGVHIGNYYSIPLVALISNGISQLTFSSTEEFSKGYVNYDIATNRMSFGVNSAERMRITSNGNVGIGTDNPLQKLHVAAGNVRADGFCIGTNCVTDWGVSGSKWTGGTGDNIHRLNGNVGIGTESPTQKLDVSGNVRVNGEMIGTIGSGLGQFRAISGNYGILLRNDGSSTYFLLTASGDQYGSWNALRPLRIHNQTGDVFLGNVLTVKHGGNVGIGTESPTQKLDVRGNIYTSGDISAPSNSWGTCTYSSWSCSNELECAAGTFMARIGRNASGVAPQCGSGSNLYYQMRIMCCQL